MDSDGITASSSTVLGAYARFDYRGLYIKSGAIVIENGLSFDNLSSDVQGSIDKSSTFVDSSNDINTITPSEKIQLKKDWTGYQADYTSITAQCSDYWPTGTTPPASQTNYINAYNDLNTFLNTTPDTNNNKAILAADNLSNSSSIDGTTLTTKTSAYLNAKASLQQDIAIQAKALADAAQAKANDIENNVVYKIEIVSSNGIFFRNGIVNTVLQAYVYRGANDITDTIDASNLIWSRVSSDPAGDIAWNTAHSDGSKSITITKDDIVNRATFDCKLLG
jgi:hypothetical protein